MYKGLFLLAVTSILNIPPSFADSAYEAAQEYSVNPVEMVALIHTETGGTYRPNAYNSRSGAMGLMQIMPFWARHFGVQPRELFDPKINIRVAAQILNYLEENFARRCPRHHSRELCRRRITPMHFYRCTRRGANSQRCHRSVGAVRNVQRRINREIRRIQTNVTHQEIGIANSCRPPEEDPKTTCSPLQISFN